MNKESIFRQLEQRIAGRALTAEALGEFNAMAIADSLKQKRSIISHHLNNLHREQRVVKVNGRPVLFLPVTVLRDHHRLAVRHGEYASIQALCADRQDSLAQLIGAQGSLQEALRQCKAAISYPGAGLPLLLRVSDQRVEPLPESEYSAPLRFQLADFAPRDNFVWVDRCYKMGQLWSPELALSTDWCVSQGQLGGEQKVQHVDKPQWHGKTAFRDTLIDMERYKGNVDTLKIVDNDIRYKADSFVFNVAGAPEEVKQFSGISRPESWGRWSNAQLGSDVKIEYKEPLPEKFDLVITAKAYGPNANKPIPVRVGESEQVLTLDNDVTTTTLHFDNPTRSNTLIITPPDPQTTNEGNILGHSPRQLGIGMVEIKVVKSEG